MLSRFADDIPHDDLRRVIDKTYTRATFGSDAITPLSTLEPGLHLLHLSNGPTLAFKDVALQLLGNLFEYVLAREHRRINVLGATSGDTGSSAEYALRGKRGVNVFMLSPLGRMSPFQVAQMFSLTDANIHNLAIEGTFDDCQDLVKAVNADAAFKSRHALGAVNSINWARVAAQVVYYFSGYFQSTRTNGEPVDFAVPSGNFGNILAGHVARELGLPIRRLILATNENDVLDEFFRTGLYRPRGSAETQATSSPSMDISKASNFERFVFDVVGRDPAIVRDALVPSGSERFVRPRDDPALAARAVLRIRFGAQQPCRPHRDHSRHRQALRRGRRSAHRGRAQGRMRASRSRRPARMPRDRAAGEVRRHHSRGARARACATRRIRRHRRADATLRRAARRCLEGQGGHRRERGRLVAICLRS